MLPDRVSNPGPLTYESGALPIALRGPATLRSEHSYSVCCAVLTSGLSDVCKKVDAPLGKIYKINASCK